MRTWVVGTRKSELALTQTNWVVDRLKEANPGLEVNLEKIVTKGDQILNVTLSKVGGKGLFVKEIEQALLEKRIDFAVHSMKDMPGEMPEGLVIGAVPVRENPLDCLITRNGETLYDLPAGAVVGTSSLRRQAQLLACRPDLVVEPVRGNLGTRLQKLRDGHFSAIILAAAGLARMDWQNEMRGQLSMEQMLPAVGQGALAIQCRADDVEMITILQTIHHEETARAVEAERAFLRTFQGGCHLPLAAYARVQGEEVELTGLVGKPDGSKLLKSVQRGRNEREIGEQLAQDLLAQGAGELLASVREELAG